MQETISDVSVAIMLQLHWEVREGKAKMKPHIVLQTLNQNGSFVVEDRGHALMISRPN
jgi:hypothetical protein